jgi:hypothetical protein
MVPVRWPPVFAATAKPTLPLPLPEEPEVIVIHEALLCAVQGQPKEFVFTASVPVLPPAAILRVDGDIVKVRTTSVKTEAVEFLRCVKLEFYFRSC